MENNAVCHEVCRKVQRVKEQRDGLGIAKYLPHWFWLWTLSTTGKSITREVRLNGPTWSLVLKKSRDARSETQDYCLVLNTLQWIHFQSFMSVTPLALILNKQQTSNRRYTFEYYNYRGNKLIFDCNNEAWMTQPCKYNATVSFHTWLKPGHCYLWLKNRSSRKANYRRMKATNQINKTRLKNTKQSSSLVGKARKRGHGPAYSTFNWFLFTILDRVVNNFPLGAVGCLEF